VQSMFQYHNSYNNILSFLMPQTSELLSQITHNTLPPLMLLAHLMQHVYTLIAVPIWIKSITHKCPPERLSPTVVPANSCYRNSQFPLTLYKPHPFFTSTKLPPSQLLQHPPELYSHPQKGGSKFLRYATKKPLPNNLKPKKTIFLNFNSN